MSFASILSEPTEDTPPPRRASPIPAPPPPQVPSHPRSPVQQKEPEPAPLLPLPKLEKKPLPEKRPHLVDRQEKTHTPPRENGLRKQEKIAPIIQARPAKGARLTLKDLDNIERKVAEIDKSEKSDAEDDTGFEAELKLYIAKSKKRAVEADILESHKTKVRIIVSLWLSMIFLG